MKWRLWLLISEYWFPQSGHFVEKLYLVYIGNCKIKKAGSCILMPKGSMQSIFLRSRYFLFHLQKCSNISLVLIWGISMYCLKKIQRKSSKGFKSHFLALYVQNMTDICKCSMMLSLPPFDTEMPIFTTFCELWKENTIAAKTLVSKTPEFSWWLLLHTSFLQWHTIYVCSVCRAHGPPREEGAQCALTHTANKV